MLQKDEMENTCYTNKKDEKFTQNLTWKSEVEKSFEKFKLIWENSS
jgi:hypothetical protein